MRRLIPLGALLPCACAPVPYTAALPPLAANRAMPAAALLEHALVTHAAGQAGTGRAPEACVDLLPGGLPAEQAAALKARFPQIAPRDRCAQRLASGAAANGTWVIRAYEMACADAEHCTGWISISGGMATKWTMRWRDGRWMFSADPRLMAGE